MTGKYLEKLKYFIFVNFCNTVAININLTTKPEGHGYGLMICKKIIENHNGKIEVISEVGNGTEFIISIPVE